MHPRDFQAYWGLTPAELANLLNRNQNTVYHWLSGTKAPGEEILKHLDSIHLRWREWQLQDESLQPYIRELYELTRDRRELRSRLEQQADPDS